MKILSMSKCGPFALRHSTACLEVSLRPNLILTVREMMKVWPLQSFCQPPVLFQGIGVYAAIIWLESVRISVTVSAIPSQYL